MGVQISGDTGNVLATKGTYTGNLTVGGVLTYEDVTNVDSVGLVTARSGIEIGARPGVAASISVDGNAIFSGITTIGGNVKVGTGVTLSPDGDVFTTGITTITANNVIGLNVENNSGSGAQTTIRSKSTETNASNFVRSESSDNKYIGLLKYGTGHSAYGALAAGGGAVYANSSVPVTIMSDGSYINFASGGNTERARIDSSGRLLLGTTTEGNAGADDLTIATSGSTGITVRSGTSGNGNLYFSDGTSGDDEYRGSIQYQHANNALVLATNAVERLRIDSNGILLHKHSASRTVGTKTGQLQVINSGNDAAISIVQTNNAASAPFLAFGKTRSANTTGSTIVQSGDSLGQILFAGADGTDIDSTGATITAQVDGTPGSNDMPGRLIFSTTADGATTSTERMRISKDGHVTKPTQFHIVVSRSGNQTGYNPSQGFGTGIVYNNSVLEQGTTSAALDTSNGRVTVPVAGIYFLEGSGYSSTAAFTQGWFTKNGSRLSYSDWMNNSGASQCFNSNGFHKLAANDTIGFKAYGSQHTSVTVEASIYHTWMRITLVG